MLFVGIGKLKEAKFNHKSSTYQKKKLNKKLDLWTNEYVYQNLASQITKKKPFNQAKYRYRL